MLSILAHYAALAFQNATHQERAARGARAARCGETFAAMGDIAANLLHHLNNKVGTIPVRVEGIQDKCAAVIEANPYLAANLVAIERAALEAMTAVREQLSLLRPIERSSVDVAGCVTRAVRAASLPPDVDVSMERLTDLPAVMANRESLTLVLANLLQNASNAMKGRGGSASKARRRTPGWRLRYATRGRASRSSCTTASSSSTFRRNRAGGATWLRAVVGQDFDGAPGRAVSVESDGRSGTTFRLKLPIGAR